MSADFLMGVIMGALACVLVACIFMLWHIRVMSNLMYEISYARGESAKGSAADKKGHDGWTKQKRHANGQFGGKK